MTWVSLASSKDSSPEPALPGGIEPLFPPVSLEDNVVIPAPAVRLKLQHLISRSTKFHMK